MTDQNKILFAFDEADHLTRIHLKLALEDAGFAVSETGERVAVIPARDDPPDRCKACRP